VKAATTGIGRLSVWHKDLEVTIALNGDVEGVAGRLEVALGLKDFSGGGAGAKADLQSGRNRLLRGSGAGGYGVLVNEVLKLNAPLAESCGICVGQVVGNVVQIGLLGRHSTCGSVERTKH